MNQQETGGFKLLEEDALDDRPCPAVKKFVASVLDRKDMKDQEVASSFRNLMEYRDSAASPSACSVGTTSSALEGDRLNSPPSPSSPTTGHAPMDDQRLPNELFDEICEDIGMKEGMELDFVEYLMEQDTNPHMYLTQEAISSGAFSSANRSSISTPTGSASGSSNSGSAHSSQSGINNNNNHHHHNHHHLNHHHHNNNNNNNDSKTLTVLNPPVATTTPNFLFKQNFTDSDWINQLPMSVVHPTSSSTSSGSTTVQSSENNSPVNKRVHLSISTDTSPNKGRSQTPPGFNQHNNNCGHPGNHNLFKLPQTGPLMTKRSHSYPQGAPSSSPVQSINSSDSSQVSNSSSHSSSTLGPHVSDQEGLISSSGAANNKKKTTHPPGSPKPALPSVHPPGDSPLSTPSQAHYNNSGPGFVGGRDGSMFQPVGKPVQAPISVKSMQHYAYQQQHPVIQQQRWIGPPNPHAVNPCGPGVYFGKGGYAAYRPFQQHQPHPAHTAAMGPGHLKQTPGPPETHHHPIAVPTTADSPLDQGYFSNESAGNCSSSAPSPAFTTSSMSSFSSVSTILPVDSQVSSTSGPRATGQKSVHFADMPQESPPLYSDSPGSISEDVKQPFTPASGVSSDCAFQAAAESNGQPKQTPSGKIMPRFHHSMKSGVAPYTVPNNQGQLVGPQLPPGYEMAARPSCALSVSGERSSPSDPMQDYMSKPTHMNGGGTGGSGSFYMDGNQNMMRMESTPDYPSLPPPLISPQPGEFVGMPTELPRYRINQYAAMQQQQSMQHPQQSAHMPNSSCESAMPPLQAHHHHHHHHHHPHPLEQHQAFSSCSYLAPGINTEMGPQPHQNNMQISHNNSDNYHLPASPAISNKSGSNGRLVGPYGAQMCSAYENIYEQRGRPAEIYPSQPAMSSPQGLMVGQPNHRGWGAEDLRVQVSGMQSSPSPAKGSLQPAHSQSLPHMQPSPTPACAAPAAHIQEISLINSGMHVTAPGLVHPPHPHMGPHPEYGPCLGLSCHICKMSQQAGGPGPPHPLSHIGPCPNPNCHMCKMTQPCAGPPPTSSGVPHAGPCAGPGCAACKMNQVRPYKFIQRLVMDPNYQAYRSHPLFSLLRDLVIAEKYFNSPEFCHQQLLNTLPDDFNRLLQNFLTRNPPTGHYQTDQGVESVIMDSLRLAHTFLLEKIRHRQELEKMKANSSASLRSMEEFCQKFDHSVTGPMGRPGPNGAMGMSHPMAGYHEGTYMQHGVTHVYRSMKEGPDVYGDSGLGVGSPQAKTESKKHPSLPKEAVAMMMEWLRNHKDNPYPNDDEKAMLIKQTGLSINQINYWFTNARRRILPKWAQCNKT